MTKQLNSNDASLNRRAPGENKIHLRAGTRAFTPELLPRRRCHFVFAAVMTVSQESRSSAKATRAASILSLCEVCSYL